MYVTEKSIIFVLNAFFLFEMSAYKICRQIYNQGQYHKYCRYCKGNSELSLLLGIYIQGNRKGRSRAAKTLKDTVQRVRKTCGKQKRGGLSEYSSHRKYAAGHNTVDTAGKHYRTDYTPFACAKSECSLSVALRNCL